MPFLRDRRDLFGQVLGGWQVSGVGKYNTGRRFTVTAGTTTIRGDQSQLRANLVEGQGPNQAPAGGRTTQQWFNTAAFFTSRTFGAVTAYELQRIVQVGLKVTF